MIKSGRVDRRTLLKLVASTSLAALPGTAFAQEAWPNRPIRLLVPFAPGGTADVAARLIGNLLGKRLNASVVPENRSGAGGTIAATDVATAPADGYSVFYATIGQLVILPILMKNLPYNAERDFVGVSVISRGTYGIAVHPDVPAKTLSEFIALAKASPDKYSYATAGIGSGPHLASELLKSMAGFDMAHVPYRGSAPALNDVISGAVPVSFDNIVSQAPFVESGRLRMLGVTSVQPAKLMPNVPPIGETVPGYEVGALGFVAVRSGTPRPIIDRLNTEIRAVLKEQAYIDQATRDGVTVIGSTVEEAEKILRAESAKWKNLIEKAGIKME